MIWIHRFEGWLVPAATEDQFDEELLHEQTLTFMFQQSHLHPMDHFNQQGEIIASSWKPVTQDDWHSQCTMMVPALNGIDLAMGVLHGMIPEISGQHRHKCLLCSESSCAAIQPHLWDLPHDNRLRDWCSFLSMIGLRPSEVFSQNVLCLCGQPTCLGGFQACLLQDTRSCNFWEQRLHEFLPNK